MKKYSKKKFTQDMDCQLIDPFFHQHTDCETIGKHVKPPMGPSRCKNRYKGFDE